MDYPIKYRTTLMQPLERDDFRLVHLMPIVPSPSTSLWINFGPGRSEVEGHRPSGDEGLCSRFSATLEGLPRLRSGRTDQTYVIPP